MAFLSAPSASTVLFSHIDSITLVYHVHPLFTTTIPSSPFITSFISFSFFSYEDISTLLEIEEELNGLEQLTIIQLGDSITPGETASNGLEKDKNESTDKDKKKSKSKLKSGKQTKSTKTAPVAAKKNTNTAPSSKKKALQGLLVLRPAQVNYMNAKISGSSLKSSADSDSDSNSDSNSNIDSDSNFENTKKGDKKDKKDRDSSSLAPTLPPLVVGRSSKQNDRITFEIAKEHHLWFHVQVRVM